ncbi:hypothetical protein [Arthrobacter psychrolactophilus]|nr:hypothetical protein [Arthrobacter psychrolactophilus]
MFKKTRLLIARGLLAACDGRGTPDEPGSVAERIETAFPDITELVTNAT